MSWSKFDDGAPEDPDISALSDRAHRAWFDSICYGNRNLTDGFVPKRIGKTMAGTAKALRELLAHVWHDATDLCDACREKPEAIEAATNGDGYYIHNFLKYQPTRKAVLEKREKDMKRKGYGTRP